LKNIGVITAETVNTLNLTGVVARSAGLNRDVRVSSPYEAYDCVNFTVPVGIAGDSYDRYLIRVEEMRNALRIITQCIELLGEDDEDESTDINSVKDPKILMSSGMEETIAHYKYFTSDVEIIPGTAYSIVEAPKGEMGVTLLSSEFNSIYRCKINAPGYRNLQGLNSFSVGCTLSDLVTIIGSLDLVLGEIDG